LNEAPVAGAGAGAGRSPVEKSRQAHNALPILSRRRETYAMRAAALGFLLVMGCAAGCDEGPCGDPVVECWTYDPTLPGCYKQYNGSGKCPQGYYCVDPRRPLEDGSATCPPPDLARNSD
jgi:hypothetical protein